MILAFDLGTSTIKAVLWDTDGLQAVGRAPVETVFPAPDRAEQDPATWWPALVAAAAAARAARPGAFAGVEAIGFAAARQTLVPVTAAGEPLGPAIVWSDRRASAEAHRLADALGGPDRARRRTGTVLDGAAVPAKVAWLSDRCSDRMAAARWILTPRDFLVLRLTGAAVTDPTMVSAAGLSDAAGAPVAELVGVFGDRLPPVVASDAVAGRLRAEPAAELGVRAGVPVVVGAGDRPCEALGTGATPTRPFVAWGTTANVSVPVASFPSPLPDGLAVTRGASGGWLLEGGLSAAGSLVAWLSGLTGLDPDSLMTEAAASPPGARGLVVLPWLGGARAPWWRDRARGAVLGLSFAHHAGDLGRAVVEAVAFEVRRCLAATGAPASSLALAGAEGSRSLWGEVLTAVTALPALRRRSGEAASAGAALLAARALGTELDLDRLDPVVATLAPDEEAVARYRDIRRVADAAATAVIGLDLAPDPRP